MKKVVLVIGVLVGLFLAAAILIPVFYDVDKKLRPQIIEAIEQNTNAKAEIGKLSLSLWTGIKINIAGFKLSEKTSDKTASEPLFSVQEAQLAVPFSAILSGKLEATFIAQQPNILMIKDSTGKLNAMKIVKASKGEAAAKDRPAGGGTGMDKQNASDAGKRVSLSLKIVKANLTYKDEMAKQTSKITDLDLEVLHIGLDKEIDILVRSQMEVASPMVHLKGPFELKGKALVKLNPGMALSLQAKLNLEKLSIQSGALFNKASGVPLGLEIDLAATEHNLNLKKCDFVVNDFKISTSGTVENFEKPSLDMKVVSNELDFAQWKSIIGILKDFNFSGKFSIDIALRGEVEKLQYNGKMQLANAGLTAPGIVVPIRDLKAELSFKDDLLTLSDTSLKMGQSDIELSGEVKNFSAPQISVKLNSGVLNVDEMLGDSKAKAQTEEEIKKDKDLTPEERDAKLESMAKGPMVAMKKNPMIKKLIFNSQTNIKKMVVKGIEITSFVTDLEFKNLVLTLNKAKLNMFSGSAQLNQKIDFNGEDPVYSTAGEINGIDLDQAIQSQMPSLKETVTGKIQSKFEIAGQGVTVAKAKQYLTGKGNFKVVGGTWSGLSALKMIGEKLEKIPGAKGQASNIKVGNRFRQLSANFNISKGNFNLENATMDLEEGNITYTTSGWINFDQQMSLNSNLYVPWSGAPADIKAKDGRANLPVPMEGAVKSPTVKWDKTVEVVGRAYLKSEGTKAISKGVEELKKNPEVQKAMEKAPEKVKDLLKGIGF